MKAHKTTKYHSTGVYLLVLLLLAGAIAAIMYLVTDPVKKYGFALIPFLLMVTAKNSVIELRDQVFVLKHYLLVFKLFEQAYAYDKMAFVHYHRHQNGFFTAFDFWGFHNRKALEVRFSDQSFEAHSIYGVSAKILRAMQEVNDKIATDEESLITDRSERLSKG